ncbi:hypothetical protein KUTeg_017575 [Tegillarca granosa]|uniref:MAU2 chromatid cohesion factor homolog n=1 Tax=Tegillarca granosa TaxID=220873 RepID=A0ABQ9EJ76_TEGGR|nr:hypothetical protein KUTeg_017575 [Tegillarca granosa]
MASTPNLEPWYVSLLGLAENFRTSNPPNIRLCIHCLQAILTCKPVPRIEARTHLQLGNILLTHTKNIDLARSHLEKAWSMSVSMQSADDIKFEAASVLGQIFEKQQIHAAEKDYNSACHLLGVGAEFAATARSDYSRLLFLLSKGMLLLIDKKMEEVHKTLSQAGTLIESYNGQPVQKESLKVFFLILQVCHYLMAGQVKSVKPALKNLQQIIQTITQLHTDEEPAISNPVESFHWLPIEHMCVLVYLVTVMHSMQAGYMDKAQKYTDKALMQIEKLKMLDAHPLLSTFQLMLLEHIIMCRLIMGNKTLAIQEIFQACQVCQQQPRLFTTHGAQVHTLLGLYAMSMNCMEAAEAQFKTAVKFIYVQIDKKNYSHSLKASAYYVQGLQSFFAARYNEAKRYLRETLKMANAEDLNRLTSCSLVLLGHIFLSLGNNSEALNMVTPAMQLAGKIPDVHVQLWASSLLKE